MSKVPVPEKPARGIQAGKATERQDPSRQTDLTQPPAAVQRLEKIKQAAHESAPVRALRNLKTAAHPPVRPVVQPVLQRYWYAEKAGSKAIWETGQPPEGAIQDGDRTKKGQPIYLKPDAQAQEAARQQELHDAMVARENERAGPRRLRRNFTPKMRAALAATPEFTERQDDDFTSRARGKGRDGYKAHLTDAGLETAGKAQVEAHEQMDNDAPKKGRSNRVSVKAPATGEDRSETYGANQIRIKIRKLARAQLRGKRDAQNVRIISTDGIVGELNAAHRARKISTEDRNKYINYAKKDREYHLEVDFLTAENTGFVIADRFIIRPDGSETHDSDSESESDTENEQQPAAISSPPPSSSAAAGDPSPNSRGGGNRPNRRRKKNNRRK